MQLRFDLDPDKTHFSGHETFPFRYDWLRKVLSNRDKFEAWKASETESYIEIAMATYGVGKNMVRSMHHWAEVAGAAERPEEDFLLTPFGKKILLESDPFLNSISTIWTLHWKIATNFKKATTWYWLFNLFPGAVINSRTAAAELKKYGTTIGWKMVSENTLKRDIECFMRCYAVEKNRKGELNEDSIECPLAELELIRPLQEDNRLFEFQRGPKPSLSDEVFIYALDEFWNNYHSNFATLSFDQISQAPGSPGRVFRLDEESIVTRLEKLSEMTNDNYVWSDTAGLQQVRRNSKIENPEKLLVKVCQGEN